jgi:hypothetical protein
MSELSDLGLHLLAAARETDPDWVEPEEDEPVRSLVVQPQDGDEVLAVGAQVGDGPRYWATGQGTLVPDSTWSTPRATDARPGRYGRTMAGGTWPRARRSRPS